MLKFGFTLSKFANNCLHKSSTAKLHPNTENDEELLEKRREDMVGGPSIVFTRDAIAEKTFIRDLTNWCNSIVRIDASQL